MQNELTSDEMFFKFLFGFSQNNVLHSDVYKSFFYYLSRLDRKNLCDIFFTSIIKRFRKSCDLGEVTKAEFLNYFSTYSRDKVSFLFVCTTHIVNFFIENNTPYISEIKNVFVNHLKTLIINDTEFFFSKIKVTFLKNITDLDNNFWQPEIIAAIKAFVSNEDKTISLKTNILNYCNELNYHSNQCINQSSPSSMLRL